MSRAPVLLIAGLLIPAAAAAAEVPNPLCRDARLVELSRPPEPLDYCDLEEAATPEAVRRFLRKVAGIERDIAALFGMTVEELLPVPIRVTQTPDPLGPLGSFAGVGGDVPWLNLTVFDGLEADDVDYSIFTHELGHIVGATADRAAMPDFLQDRVMSPLVLEGMADFIAVAVTGAIVGSPSRLPGCLNKMRLITTAQTFKGAEGYFASDFFLRRMEACCKATAPSFPANPYARSACDGLQALLDQYGGQLGYDSSAHAWLKPFSHERLKAADASSYDPHQLGIPLNSFLRKVGKEFGVDPWKAQVEALRRANSYRKARCRHLSEESSGGSIQEYDLDLPATTLRAVLAELRQGVAAARPQDFDQLLEAFAMPVAYEIDEADLADSLSSLGSKAVAEKQGESSPCYGVWVTGYVESTGCRLSCAPL
jgi:hypothetical protein